MAIDPLKYLNKTWRITHLYKIVDKQGRLIQFPENVHQQRIRESKKRRKIILKSRQLGITTGAAIDLFDYAIHTPNVNTAIIAHKQKDLPKIFDIVRRAHKHMVPELQPILDKGGGSKYELRFPELGSKIYVDIEVRGETLHRAHFSETAFAEAKRINASLAALPPHAPATFESTPNGIGNYFHKRWTRKSFDTEKFFFPWYTQPEYQLDGSHIKQYTGDEQELIEYVKKAFAFKLTRNQIAWRRAQIAELGDMFAQEYPENDRDCFLATGGNPFDLRKISKLYENAPEPISDDGLTKVWKERESGDRYVIGADVAEGVRSDYSVADVISMRHKTQVAQLRSNQLKPFDFAREIYTLAKKYHKGGGYWPLVGVELNNHGHAVNGKLKEDGYPNLYHYKPDTAGWLTNSVTRPKMIDTFIEAIESDTVTFNSDVTFGECLSLTDNGGKIQAEDGEHDDAIISAAITVQMLIEDSVGDVYDNLDKKIFM